MNAPSLESASGLRPAMAYLLICVVLATVGGRAWVLAMEQEHHQPRGAEREEFLPRPDFDLVDREGRPLALSVQRMDLRLSPRSMWQAHTPRLMAEEILPHLGGEFSLEQLLQAFVPSARDGVVRVTADGWTFDYATATRLERWAHERGVQEFLWLERDGDKPAWTLAWRPVELLDRTTRALHSEDPEEPISPLRWTRTVADGVANAIAPRDPEAERLTWEEQETRREGIWRALLPDGDAIAVRGLPAESVVDLIALLDEQGVQGHQMSIEFEHERVYPARDRCVLAEAAHQVVGKWRYLDPPEAQRRADRLGGTAAERKRRARELLDVKHPCSGLEGVAARVLARPEFDFIRPAEASYRYRRSVPVHQPSRRYYYDESAEEATPTVVSTIDAHLQEFLHAQLREARAEHGAAAVQGIVVEVATGDVLAVAGDASHPVSEFLPTWHLFSPGSTFKVVVMATALEAGVVTYHEEFDTHDGHYRIPNSRRTIHEARGAPGGWIPAWTALSKSVNAVMVQIGMRVPDEFFHAKLIELGYLDVAHAGVGVERSGHLPKLPWKGAWAHASVSFGHEISVNLWQHAQALATILRGGVRRPLRVVSGVEWAGAVYPLPLEDGERVYRADTCDTVRAMMAEGALSGTGRHINAAEKELGTPIELRSKTGTTEKEPGVVCLHKELERNAHNAQLPGGRQDPGFVTFNQIKQQPKPHSRSCYTSSICLVGRVPGEEREVMVLIVVEEPTTKLKFGSDVAGPWAIAALKEALGLTVHGEPVAERAVWEPSYGYEEAPEGALQPWREAAGVEASSGGAW